VIGFDNVIRSDPNGALVERRKNTMRFRKGESAVVSRNRHADAQCEVRNPIDAQESGLIPKPVALSAQSSALL
jgi:hypothetical protein